jgi:eukaryotic-like serine/threonine-protein kinase
VEDILVIGNTLGHYQISNLIGKGGMGEVYRAKDQVLGRDVAIKVLPEEFARDSDRVARFQREARVLASLNHPNIAAIHGLEESGGTKFLVLELVEGQTLAERIKHGPIPVEDSLEMALQIADALKDAHDKGIIHRDLKPANIKVTPDEKVKVLDFGLAKAFAGDYSKFDLSKAPTVSEVATEQGSILGTPAYMSPEQAEGKPIDPRSDIFSFGSVLYEIVTGRRAFQGESASSTISAILRDTPTPVRKLREGVPATLERIIDRCLEKNKEMRYASATELGKEITAIQAQRAAEQIGVRQLLRKPQIAIPVLVLLVAIAAMIAWYRVHSSRVRWARNVALPEIARLHYDLRGYAALRLIERALPYLQGDPEFERLRQYSTVRVSIRTDPPGADCSIRDYSDVADNAEWMHLGRTPLESVVIPEGFLVYRIDKPGFDEVERTHIVRKPQEIKMTLNAKGTNPPGMIWIPGPKQPEGGWLDKYEVTNRQFKEFLDRDGYDKKEYWKIPFVNEEGRIIPWAEAMARFKDVTGRPGPAIWEYGTYPQDRADYPVSGVSWYEASAYAEFAGKSLPPLRHWINAAGTTQLSAAILQLSNFAGKDLAPVGSYRGLGPYGNYDMAGNVKEWCMNSSGMNRYILGGAWNDPNYMFSVSDLRHPMNRSPVNGFRCAKYKNALPKELRGTVQPQLSDRRGDKAVNDTIFQIYKTIHEYDHGDLKQKIEATAAKSSYWRLEKVSYQAAYGNERVTAYLFLPKNATPPYQTVVYFPMSGALSHQTSENLENLGTRWFDFIVRSGRALIHPIYKGTFERAIDGFNFGKAKHDRVWREIAIDSAKDLGRSLDYLETRPDIDRQKLAYYGYSMGACEGPRLIALEPRFKAGVLIAGGAYERGWPAEIDPFNFAPHTRVPILMVNGMYDPFANLTSSQIPLFQMLGTPEKDKKHVVVEGGHMVFNEEVIRESLAWLDRYLGPVRIR